MLRVRLQEICRTKVLRMFARVLAVEVQLTCMPRKMASNTISKSRATVQDLTRKGVKTYDSLHRSEEELQFPFIEAKGATNGNSSEIGAKRREGE